MKRREFMMLFGGAAAVRGARAAGRARATHRRAHEHNCGMIRKSKSGVAVFLQVLPIVSGERPT
jgi:hypothetical protein